MIIIAHRANLYGPGNLDQENKPKAIRLCLDRGFHVEVDITHGPTHGVCLGHDNPDTPIQDWMYKDEKMKDKIIWHAKDLRSAEWAANNLVHFFMHDQDNYGVTSRKLLWTALDDMRSNNLIVVTNRILPPMEVPSNKVEGKEEKLIKLYGICTDHPYRQRDAFAGHFTA